MDDVGKVLNLLDRYATVQQALTHQTSIQRDRLAGQAVDLLVQAAAMYDVLHDDPERWEQAEINGVADALTELKQASARLTVHDVKQYGVSWRFDV